MSLAQSRSRLVRPATPADVEALILIERRCPTAAHWADDEYHRLFASDTPERIALVIEAEGDMKGLLVAKIVEKECELENIAVCESARRKGCGALLLAELTSQAKARGVTAIFLEVRASNQSACLFYETRGFQKCGTRRRYYADPVEDAVLYRLQT